MGREPLRHARARLCSTHKRLSSGVAAAVGLVLMAPGLAAPAAAGTEGGGLDRGVVVDTGGLPGLPGLPDLGTGLPLVPPAPVIAPGGAGHVEFLGAVVCSSDGSVTKTCNALPLAGLGDTVSLVLTAVPARAGDVPRWDPTTCPDVVAAVCTIPVTDLLGSTPLAPVVSFLPGLGGAGAPDTTITSAAPGKTSTTHTFTFDAEPRTDATTFECKLQVTYRGTPSEGAQAGHDWRLCETGMTYQRLADGDYVFAVKAIEGTGDEAVEDESPATQSWTTAVPPRSPETRIVSGPNANAWLLSTTVTYRFTSTVQGSEFQCDLGSRTYPCDRGSFTVRRPAAGSHLFEVYAMAGRTRDLSPATRRFHVPLDDRDLEPVRSWTGKKVQGHFKNTVRETTVKGAALVTRGTQKFRRIALVADKGRGHGTVRVFWNKRLLREVSLWSRREQRRQVIPVKSFSGKLRKGTLRIVVVSSGKVVRIDGLGIADR